MSPIAIIYGAMSLLAAFLAVRGHSARDVDASRPMFAVLISVSWFATEIARLAGTLNAWPAMDAMLACMLASSYVQIRRSWKLALLTTYVAQAFGHVGFSMADDGSDAAFMVYASANNALFVLQLIIVAREGGRKAWDDVRDGLSVHMRRCGYIRPGAFQSSKTRNEGVGDEDVAS